MKRFLSIVCAVLFLLPILAGCSSLSGKSTGFSASEEDQQLALNVVARLKQDPITQRVALGVTAQDGVVTLHGAVPSNQVRTHAVGIADSTEGVVRVRDNTTLFAR